MVEVCTIGFRSHPASQHPTTLITRRQNSPPTTPSAPTIHDICAPPPLPHILSQEAPPRKEYTECHVKRSSSHSFLPQDFLACSKVAFVQTLNLGDPSQACMFAALVEWGGRGRGDECGPGGAGRLTAHTGTLSPLTRWRAASRVFAEKIYMKNIFFFAAMRVGPCRGKYFVANSTRTGGAHVRPDWIDVYAAQIPISLQKNRSN